MADSSKSKKNLAAARKKFKELKAQKGPATDKPINADNLTTSSSSSTTPPPSSSANTQEIIHQPPASLDLIRNDFFTDSRKYFEQQDVPRTNSDFIEPSTPFEKAVATNNTSDGSIANASTFFEQQVFDATPNYDAPKPDTRNAFSNFFNGNHQHHENASTQNIDNNHNNNFNNTMHSFPDAENIGASANIESLHQISSQISSIINPSDVADTTSTLTSNLMQRNQELSVLCSAEKAKNVELSSKIGEQSSTISSLKREMQQLKHDNSLRLTMEMGPLQEQLQSHVQTVGVLVGEKAELTASLSKYQSLAKEKSNDVEELQGRLNASRHRVQELERELSSVRKGSETFSGVHDQLNAQLNDSKTEFELLKRSSDENAQELSETKQKLLLQKKETEQLQNELRNKTAELNLNQLRIEQLSSGDVVETGSKIENLTHEKIMYEQQVQELQKMMQQVVSERDQSCQRFQNYVQNLNQETATLAEKIQELTLENERLSQRESGLVRHVGELERQMQQQIAKQSQTSLGGDAQKEVAAIHSAEINKLTESNEEFIKQLDAEKDLVLKVNDEMEKLQIELAVKNNRVVELESLLERVQSEQPDAVKLMSTIESDKVAASRAVSQNLELKQQLHEMEKAFVQLSNDKLELTDRLQTEQHLGREIKSKFGSMESDLRELSQKFSYKDEEMIRLTHENTELNKQLLGLHQEVDRLRHYEAKGQSGTVLEAQLKSANEKIRRLKTYIDELEQNNSLKPTSDDSTTQDNLDSSMEAHLSDSLPASPQHDSSDHTDMHQENADLRRQTEHLLNVIDAMQRRADAQHHSTSNTTSAELARECLPDDTSSLTSSTVMIATDEAHEKLQQRFRRTMIEIADLSEEKHRLEHLVMQLQGETETIGEYIALYQTQRRLLKQREIEKDTQLQRITADREEMRDKLMQLNSLVENLLQRNGTSTAMVAAPHENGVIEPPSIMMGGVGDKRGMQPQLNAASQILTLLSEIKEKNQTDLTATPVPTMHHCSCCSGVLETV